ncbi:Allatostatin-A receptor, partial [Cryptotermes secundus]
VPNMCKLFFVFPFQVVLVVAANQQMRSTTNLLIINLAVADLLFIVFCVPFTATDYVLPFWPFGDVWCKIVQYLIVVTAYASVYTLVLMSLDRFMAVVHPIASMSIRTERNAIAAIAVTWVVILLASVPVYLSHGEITYTYSSTQHTACVFLEADPVNRPEGYNKPAFQIIFFATSYVTPLALICGLYLWLLLRLWRGAAPGGHVSEESRRGKRRVTRMVVVVVAIFAVCWFPIQVRIGNGVQLCHSRALEVLSYERMFKSRSCQLICGFIPYNTLMTWYPHQLNSVMFGQLSEGLVAVPDQLRGDMLILVLKSVDRYEITNTSVMIQIVSHVLAYMNSCVNPILYAFLSDHFRKAFRKVMNCGNAKNTQLGSRYHRGSAVQGQANGRGPNIKSCHEDDNKSALLNVSKTTRLNGNSSRDIF